MNPISGCSILTGIFDSLLQPTRAELKALYSKASWYWSREAHAAIREVKNGLNLKSFEIRNMLGRVPPIPDRCRYGLLTTALLASTWRVTGSKDCEISEKAIQIPPVQLRLLISTPTNMTLTGQSSRKWVEFEGDDQPNLLAVLALAWSYILSARLMELQGRDGSKIIYTETTTPLYGGDERLYGFSVDVGTIQESCGGS